MPLDSRGPWGPAGCRVASRTWRCFARLAGGV